MENPSPRRVSLRHVGPDGSVHDVVGELVAADDARVVVLPHGRGAQHVERQAIRAMKWAPPRVVRPSSRVDDLERLLARTWPGTEQVRMGGWVLRAGLGVTQRANSVLPLGDVERSRDEALAGIQQFYASRGITPAIQTSARDFDGDEPGAELDRDLAARGWLVGDDTHVMVRALDGLKPWTPRFESTWRDQPDNGWLGLEPLAEARRSETETAPAQYLTLHDEGTVVARARLAPSDDWVVLAGLLVAPEHRRRGLGRELVLASLQRARDEGFGFAALQVEAHNQPAIALYRSLGFERHHSYRYRSLPSPS